MNGKTLTDPMSKNRARVHWMAKTGILSAIAVLLMYLETSLPVLMPKFLKFDFSETAVLLASFSMGPLTGILVELIKNLLHLPATFTGGIGELANFVVGSSFVGTAGLIYRFRKSRSGAYLGMAAGTITMTLVACLTNYFIMIPFYIQVMGLSLQMIVDWSTAVGNKLVVDLPSLIAWVFVPFNLFKGIVISLIVGLIYKRISPLLHR